jgi:hypothetical protein
MHHLPETRRENAIHSNITAPSLTSINEGSMFSLDEFSYCKEDIGDHESEPLSQEVLWTERRTRRFPSMDVTTDATLPAQSLSFSDSDEDEHLIGFNVRPVEGALTPAPKIAKGSVRSRRQKKNYSLHNRPPTGPSDLGGTYTLIQRSIDNNIASEMEIHAQRPQERPQNFVTTSAHVTPDTAKASPKRRAGIYPGNRERVGMVNFSTSCEEAVQTAKKSDREIANNRIRAIQRRTQAEKKKRMQQLRIDNNRIRAIERRNRKETESASYTLLQLSTTKRTVVRTNNADFKGTVPEWFFDDFE